MNSNMGLGKFVGLGALATISYMWGVEDGRNGTGFFEEPSFRDYTQMTFAQPIMVEYVAVPKLEIVPIIIEKPVYVPVPIRDFSEFQNLLYQPSLLERVMRNSPVWCSDTFEFDGDLGPDSLVKGRYSL
jgi:hypothetical protein